MLPIKKKKVKSQRHSAERYQSLHKRGARRGTKQLLHRRPSQHTQGVQQPSLDPAQKEQLPVPLRCLLSPSQNSAPAAAELGYRAHLCLYRALLPIRIPSCSLTSFCQTDGEQPARSVAAAYLIPDHFARQVQAGEETARIWIPSSCRPAQVELRLSLWPQPLL